MLRHVGPIASCATVVGLPVMIYLFTTNTKVGPTVFSPSWSPGNGVHLGDTLAVVVALPIWSVALLQIARKWHSAAARTRDGKH